MSCTIEVKRKRVFIVGTATFENRKEAQEYLERYPYEYDGERYMSKSGVRSAIAYDKFVEITEAFDSITGLSFDWHDGRIGRDGKRKIGNAMGNLEFLKKALQIAEKYDRLMEPFKE
ncbi:MAG: hypothetical protein VW907_03450, partial [Opitutae bacterium]